MTAAIHQPQYWPGLRFFAKMRASDLFIYLDDVQFEKREYQNRNRIRNARGWQYLTVPVISKGKFSQKINEAELDNSADWRAEHLLAIRTNYGRARFFALYRAGLEKLYSREYRLLGELAAATAEFVCSALAIKVPVRYASKFGVAETSTGRLVKLCEAAGADEYLSGAGARAYLDEKFFDSAGIKVSWQHFLPREYPQVFPGFEPDMSALDLLLNCGPESVNWL
jgi:hypothetical protein